MKDIAFNNCDLQLIDQDLGFMEDSEALTKQLEIFLNIRAAHKNGLGEVIVPGELEFDQNNGIDFTYILDSNTTERQIGKHYKSQMLKYYKQYITQITKMEVEKNRSMRDISIDFEYKTIWSNEIQSFRIEVV